MNQTSHCRCAVCAGLFALEALIDVDGYPVCKPCLEATAKGTSSGRRKLRKIVKGRAIAGVCGGLARFCNMEVTVMRLLAIAGAVFTGGTLVLAYVVMAFVIPDDGDDVDDDAGARSPHFSDGREKVA